MSGELKTCIVQRCNDKYAHAEFEQHMRAKHPSHVVCWNCGEWRHRNYLRLHYGSAKCLEAAGEQPMWKKTNKRAHDDKDSNENDVLASVLDVRHDASVGISAPSAKRPRLTANNRQFSEESQAQEIHDLERDLEAQTKVYLAEIERLRAQLRQAEIARQDRIRANAEELSALHNAVAPFLADVYHAGKLILVSYRI